MYYDILKNQPDDLDKSVLPLSRAQFTFRNEADMMPNPDQNSDWHASSIQLHSETEPSRLSRV